MAVFYDYFNDIYILINFIRDLLAHENMEGIFSFIFFKSGMQVQLGGPFIYCLFLVTWLNMCIMTQLVISAIYYLGKSFDNEDDTKFVISLAVWKFIDIDVIFLNEIIRFVIHHLHVWAALCMSKFSAFALQPSFPF